MGPGSQFPLSKPTKRAMISPRLLIHDGQRLVCSLDLSGPVELGRQRKNDEGPYSRSVLPQGTRVVIANRNDVCVSRNQLRVEAIEDRRVALTNLSGNLAIALADGRRLRPGSHHECALPVSLQIGGRTISIETASGHQAPQGGGTGAARSSYTQWYLAFLHQPYLTTQKQGELRVSRLPTIRFPRTALAQFADSAVDSQSKGLLCTKGNWACRRL